LTASLLECNTFSLLEESGTVQGETLTYKNRSKKKDLQELVLNECQMMMQCSAIHQESNQIRLKQLAGA
jgi:hypothetical protein